MQDDGSALIWLLGLLVLIIGLIVGIIIDRFFTKMGRRIPELEKQLAQSEKEITEYREQVDAHFIKTSELFSHMTESYREIYTHLAHGAQNLCNEETVKLASKQYFSIAQLEESAEEIENPPEAEENQETESSVDTKANGEFASFPSGNENVEKQFEVESEGRSTDSGGEPETKKDEAGDEEYKPKKEA